MFYHSPGRHCQRNVYFWGEPLYGFYTTIDKFVLRKHAELLADAGVDVIIFDCTNGTWIWEDSCMALLDTFAKARADGVNTPQVAFMLNFAGNSNSKTQLIELYDKIYSKNLYRDLWFMWEGKPLIMAYPEAMDQASPAASSDEVNTIKSFFTFRRNEPTYFASDKTYSKKTWGWCSVYPQTKFGVRSDGSVEQMTVSVAQNATDTQLIAMNAPVARRAWQKLYERQLFIYI